MITLLLADKKVPKNMKPYRCTCDSCEQGKNPTVNIASKVVAITQTRKEALRYFNDRGWGADPNHQTCPQCVKRLAAQISQVLKRMVVDANGLEDEYKRDQCLHTIEDKTISIGNPPEELSSAEATK